MIVPDTSVWIKYFRAEEPYSTELRDLISAKRILAVSAAFGEVFQGVKSKREYQFVMRVWKTLPKTDETDMFLEAGVKNWRHAHLKKGVGLIDSYLLCLAEKERAKIWTLDEGLRSVTPAHLLYR